jgi:lysozyme family protein
MADFDISYEKTCKNEGGYTLDPHETWMGIDRAEEPGWHGWSLVDSMRNQNDFPHCLSANAELLQSVEEFFRANYWRPVRGDEITDQGIADKLYDAGVNMGTGTAIRLIQEALNLVEDGIIGPKTIGAINNTPPAVVLSRFKDARIAHYQKIVTNHPEDRKYLASWLSRC